MNGSRLGAVRVTGELMRQLFFTPDPGRGWRRVSDGLPPDAEYRRMYHDRARDQFVFVFAHDSFPLTPPGCEVRALDVPLLETWTDPALAPRPAVCADTPHIAGG